LSTTRYFDEQVLRKRPYLSIEMCRNVVADPIRSEVQEDGRMRYWGEVSLQGKHVKRILRVVTLDDGVTIHNAFLDRGYREDQG
jgi:hypothetical protein